MAINTRNGIIKIPPELLGEIFTYAALLDPDAPLLVGEVCELFHRVVRRTPHAWRRLHISLSGVTAEGDGKGVRKAELWFAMAVVLPVDVVVEISPALESYSHVPSSSSHQKKDGELQLHLQDVVEPLFPRVLSTFNKRIRALELSTTTVAEGRDFIAALYPFPASALLQSEEYPLESLTLHASSDGSLRFFESPRAHSRVRLRGTSTSWTTSTAIVTLPPSLPHLKHLTLYNHSLPTLSFSSENVCNLRELHVHYPLRFAPMSLGTLFAVLRGARRLESVILEGRVVDDLDGSASRHVANNVASTSGSKNDNDDNTLIPLARLACLSLRTNNIPAILSHLLMPSLRSLSVDDLDGKRRGAGREMASVMRGVLVRMDMPCDMEGEGSVERGRGLEVLDMCSVSLSSGGSRSPSPFLSVGLEEEAFGAGGRESGGGEMQGEAETETAETLWAWCFNRMRALRELRVRKMDVEGLLGLITPSSFPTPAPCSVLGRRPQTLIFASASMDMQVDDTIDSKSKVDDVVTVGIPLPSLEKLVIVEQEVSHPRSSTRLQRTNAAYFHLTSSISSSSSISPTSKATPTSLLAPPSSLFSPTAPSDPLPSQPRITPRLKTFQLRRPEVEVVCEVVPVVGLVPGARKRGSGSGSGSGAIISVGNGGGSGGGGVDFLELYS